MLTAILLLYEKQMFEALSTNSGILSVEKTEYEGNNRIVSLVYTKKDDALGCTAKGIFRINVKDWSITEYEKTVTYTGNKTQQLSIDTLKAKDYSRRLKCRYNNYQGLYYIGSVYINVVRDIIAPHETVLCEWNVEYATNGIYSNTSPSILKGDLMNRKENIYKQVWKRPYHPEFWKNYNLIVDNPALEKIRKDLNVKGSLDEQFNNGNKYQGSGKSSK
jgi:hypothetical protein